MKKTAKVESMRVLRHSGFTLIELLVVVAIIAMLVGIVIGVAGTASRKSGRARALSELERVKSAMEEYRIANGSYWKKNISDYGSDFDEFTNEISKIEARLSFVDPWGRPYQYQASSPYLTYRLWSHGLSTNTTDDDVDSSSGNY